jgi:Family of unknown function (DUF5681)
VSDDYEIGYGKPPKSGQWKPGQSGNPKGRPKGRDSFLRNAAAILSTPVKATAPGGGSVTLDALEAAYLALCRKALKGDAAALYRSINIILELVPAGEAAQEKRVAEGQAAKELLAKVLGIDVREGQPPT